MSVGLRGKLLAVFAVLGCALAAVVVIAVHATRVTTSGARGVDVEFFERVATDKAQVAATDDLRQVEARLAVGRSPRANDGAVADSGRALASAITRAVRGGNGVRPTERQDVARLNQAYRQYLIVRRQIVGADDAVVARRRIERAFTPLQSALSAYGAGHFVEAQEGLDALERQTRGRTETLIAALLVLLLSMLAVSGVLANFTRRVRECLAFTERLAAGNLQARVREHGSDELAVLAGGLNAMACELEQNARDISDRAEQEHRYRETQRQFRDRLQVAGSESEAHQLLQAHLAREVPSSSVVVLTRNNSHDRLLAATAPPPGWALEERLATASPRSCLSLRLARPYAESDVRSPLMSCELCGKLAPNTTCSPLLVGGEVIGSVLLGHPEQLAGDEARRVAESVEQSAPVLANLRNLALAEARASTDALTGLPNRRALQENLMRMLAQAGRTVSPLSVIALDLDHFKAINDTHGHDRGDAVLAAVGDLLTSSIRESDLAARAGGEEFVVLLPDTSADGALEVAEKLRSGLAAMADLDLHRALTASFGVATYPDHATDASTLLRLADRALYAAKAGGRDRAELTAR